MPKRLPIPVLWLIALGMLVSNACGPVQPSVAPSPQTSAGQGLGSSPAVISTPALGLSPTPAIKAQVVYDLVGQGKVEIRVRGYSIEYVTLEIHRLVQTALAVEIPAGAYFVADQAGHQNMIARRSKEVILENDDWTTVNVEAACGNRELNIPGDWVNFSLQEPDQLWELELLMPVLETAQVTFDVEQAAIWILTDDASYEDLGTLSLSFGNSNVGIGRAIDETDAVQAMQLVDQAGIEITWKSIWQDRAQISQKLEDPALKAWLIERETQGVMQMHGSEAVLQHGLWIDELAFSPDETRIATFGCTERENSGNCSGGDVIVWDTLTGNELSHMEGPSDRVKDLRWTPDGDFLIGAACEAWFEAEFLPGCSDAVIRIWESATGTLIDSIDSPALMPFLEISPDGRWLAVSTCLYLDGSHCSAEDVLVVDRVSGEMVSTLAGLSGLVESVQFSPDATLVATLSDGEVWFWDPASGTKVGTLGDSNSYVEEITWGSNGLLAVATCTYDQEAKCISSEIQIRKPATDQLLQTFPVDIVTFYGMAWTPDSQSLSISGCPDFECDQYGVSIWDVVSGERLSAHPSVLEFVISSNGQWVAITRKDGVVHLLEANRFLGR